MVTARQAAVVAAIAAAVFIVMRFAEGRLASTNARKPKASAPPEE